MQALLAALAAQEKAFEAVAPRLRQAWEEKQAAQHADMHANSQRKAAEASAGGAAAASSGAKPKFASSTADLLAKAESQYSASASTTMLEYRDAKSWRVSLMTEPWDSYTAVTTNKGPFIASLPSFSFMHDRGHNALFLKAEYTQRSEADKVWTAISIAPSEHMTDFVLGHVSMRDVVRGGGAGAGAGDGTTTLRREYVQGYKLKVWESDKAPVAPGLLPAAPDRSFWWRIVFTPWGMASFIDGRFIKFTKYPPERAPREGETLFMQLHTSGEKGEPATLRVREAYWDHATLDPSLAPLIQQYVPKGPGAAIAAARPGAGPGAPGAGGVVLHEVRVTGLPASATAADLEAAITARYGPTFVARDAAGKPAIRMEGAGAATVALVSTDAALRVLIETGADLSLLSSLGMPPDTVSKMQGAGAAGPTGSVRLAVRGTVVMTGPSLARSTTAPGF